MGKKILSAILSLAVLASGMSAMGMTAAAEESTSNDYGLAEKTSEGVILHAFNWSYNTIKENLPAIAEAGYTTVQTSPVQQPKNRSDSKDTAGQWWKLYQPL
ncbi:MAG: alpha-amylase, partial [Clostridia bacterium]|nr:alpha-amylase [Clostridia bacterium]